MNLGGRNRSIRSESAAHWSVELVSKDGRIVWKSENLTRKQAKGAAMDALRDELPVPHYAWQLELRIRWEGATCPAGHSPERGHPEHPTKQGVETAWTEALDGAPWDDGA